MGEQQLRVLDVRAGASVQHAAETSRQLAGAFASAPVGIAVTTESGVLVQANAALAALLDYPVAALLGRRLADLAAPDAAAALADHREHLLAGGSAQHVIDSHLQRADGRAVPVTLTCARVPADAEGCGYLVVHVQDATERLAAEAELIRRSLHDPLTGLPNRVLLIDRLEWALARLARTGGSVAVLFADLNGFKAVNDTHGHPAGDQVLVAVGRRLQLLQRPGDTVCRYGGDEFVVLCADSGRAQADSVAKRIHSTLTTPISWVPADLAGPAAPSSVTLTASIGIATTSDPTASAHQLLHTADAAMYRTKHH